MENSKSPRSEASIFYINRPLWDLQWSQEKTKTMLMQNLRGQTKSIMVFSEVAYNALSQPCPVSFYF